MEEMPALRWAQVSGTAGGQAAGCVLVNDCKYGHSLQGSTLRLTLIRASYDPDILPEIGQHEVHMALGPFAGEMPVADAIRMGQDLAAPCALSARTFTKERSRRPASSSASAPGRSS